MADSHRGKKQNRDKHPYERQLWMQAKKQGRPKQIWNKKEQQWEKQKENDDTTSNTNAA